MIVSLIILVATANIELLLIIVLLLNEKNDCVDYDNQSVEEIYNKFKNDYEIDEYDVSYEEDFEEY